MKKKSEFYTKTFSFLSTIGERGKNFYWLMEKMKISGSHSTSLNNGNKSPSAKLIHDSAIILKEFGCNIFTPKQILPGNYGVKSSSGYFQNNIQELMKKYDIDANELYNNNVIAKNTLLRLMKQENVISLQSLIKIANFFLKKKLIEDKYDLIYFPKWGETSFTYIKYKKKYKKQ